MKCTSFQVGCAGALLLAAVTGFRSKSTKRSFQVLAVLIIGMALAEEYNGYGLAFVTMVTIIYIGAYVPILVALWTHPHIVLQLSVPTPLLSHSKYRVAIDQYRQSSSPQISQVAICPRPAVFEKCTDIVPVIRGYEPNVRDGMRKHIGFVAFQQQCMGLLQCFTSSSSSPSSSIEFDHIVEQLVLCNIVSLECTKRIAEYVSIDKEGEDCNDLERTVQIEPNGVYDPVGDTLQYKVWFNGIKHSRVFWIDNLQSVPYKGFLYVRRLLNDHLSLALFKQLETLETCIDQTIEDTRWNPSPSSTTDMERVFARSVFIVPFTSSSSSVTHIQSNIIPSLLTTDLVSSHSYGWIKILIKSTNYPRTNSIQWSAPFTSRLTFQGIQYWSTVIDAQSVCSHWQLDIV